MKCIRKDINDLVGHKLRSQLWILLSIQLDSNARESIIKYMDPTDVFNSNIRYQILDDSYSID